MTVIPGELIFSVCTNFDSWQEIQHWNRVSVIANELALKEKEDPAPVISKMIETKLEIIPYWTNFIKCIKHAVILNPDTIIPTMKQFAKILNPETNGDFRQGVTFIFHSHLILEDFSKESFKKLDDHFLAKKDKAYNQWANETRKKIWDSLFRANKKALVIDKKDLECLSQVATIFPDYDLIPKKIVEIKQIFNSSPDCYEIAAKIHQFIVRLHPFQDGNGRIARLMMNLILIQAEKKPILFNDMKDYCEATASDKFAEYIKTLAEKQPKCDPLVSQTFYNLYIAKKP